MILAALLGCAPAADPPLVIVVSLDTLRADRLGAYGNTDGLTPNLDRLAAESVVFDRAYATANETLYSHASLFTSRWPTELSALDDGFSLPIGTPTLATVLTAYDWRTAAFVAGGHLRKEHGTDAGFSVYDDTASWGSLHDTVPRALAWLDAPGDGRPRFLFVHGYDTHDRYLKPTPFGYARTDPAYDGPAREAVRGHGRTSLVLDNQLPGRIEEVELLAMTQPRPGRKPFVAAEATRLDDADIAHVAAVYDASVAYADAWFGRFMAGLEARGLYDLATIVVLSDHGEHLGTTGVFHHRYTLDETTLQVPLVVRLPNGAHGGRHLDGLVELTDVMPTVLELAGATPPAGIRGVSLLSALTGTASLTRTVTHAEGAQHLLSVADSTARLTASGLSHDAPSLTALLEHTPFNAATLTLTGDAARGPALRAALVDWRASVPLGARRTPTEAERRALREQGYWSATP